MDKVLEQKKNNLLKLAKNNQTDKIYKSLNEFEGSSTQKGDLFEYFLEGLYKGIGCKAEVKGGKGDGGVDLVIYYGNSPSKVYAIVQAKNLKKALTTDQLLIEYAKLVGDNISTKQASAKTYKSKNIFIFSLNGYVQNADKLKTPKKYTVKLYQWSDVQKLIEKYSNKSQKKCPFNLVQNNIYYLVIFLLLAVASWFFYKENDVEKLNNQMLERLNNTQMSSYVRQDCQNFNYPLNTCREQLVYGYMKKYDSLEKGLMVYFCGETNFKRANCKYGQKQARFILHGTIE